MKLRDLLNETRVFQNNFIKVDMVEDELKKIFKNEKTPKIKFDEDGMFITVDNFTYRHYFQENNFNTFSLIDAGLIDEIKNIKKYYVEFNKVKPEEEIEDGEESSNEEGVQTPK